jgi:hypothetical protein
MQTLELEFKHLDKLPVPTHIDEILLVEIPNGMIRPIETFNSMITSELFFNCHLRTDLRYAHIKITTKPEPAFKVGDRVKWKPDLNESYPNGSIIEIIDNKYAIVFSHYTSKRKALTDLTLITE